MSRRRMLSQAGLSSVAAAAAAVAGASWYYASRLTEPPMDVPAEPPEHDDVVQVAEVTADTVTLVGPDADRAGQWGLDTPGGYGCVSEILATHVDEPSGHRQAQRRMVVQQGTIVPGATAILDGYAYPPIGAALHPAAIEVTYDTPVGPAPAWHVPGHSRTWAITVHGRGALRHEAFRIAPTLIAAGLPLLAIAYRNDGEGPRSPDGRSHLGAREWEDVEAAIRYALAHGAEDVLLVGFSMGGACVTACVRLSELAGRVRAMILEAPVLDWGPVVRRAALRRGLPAAVLPALLPTTFAMARARVGIDWASLRPDPAALTLPLLLLHGAVDQTVPVELSDAFAAARPDIVTYLRFPGADHVRCWNVDAAAYEAAVSRFLASVALA